MTHRPPIDQARVNSLLEEALWELGNEGEQAPEQTDALDSMIIAARANLMGGENAMMAEEADILFSNLTHGPLSAERSSSIAARAAQLRQIHAQAQPPAAAVAPIPATAAPVPTESPFSVMDTWTSDEPPQDSSAAEADADGDEWEEWPSDAPTPPAVAQPPTPAERAAAAAQRIAQERELRMQRNGGTLRNRAAEIEAERAAEAVLANLPSRPPLDDGAAARW